jgi:hypothetical protein
MNRLLTLTALIEAAAGLALMAVPSVVARLLLGGEISGAGIPLGRVAGFGLLSLGIARVQRTTHAQQESDATLLPVFSFPCGASEFPRKAPIQKLITPAIAHHASNLRRRHALRSRVGLFGQRPVQERPLHPLLMLDPLAPDPLACPSHPFVADR